MGSASSASSLACHLMPSSSNLEEPSTQLDHCSNSSKLMPALGHMTGWQGSWEGVHSTCSFRILQTALWIHRCLHPHGPRSQRHNSSNSSNSSNSQGSPHRRHAVGQVEAFSVGPGGRRLIALRNSMQHSRACSHSRAWACKLHAVDAGPQALSPAAALQAARAYLLHHQQPRLLQQQHRHTCRGLARQMKQRVAAMETPTAAGPPCHLYRRPRFVQQRSSPPHPLTCLLQACAKWPCSGPCWPGRSNSSTSSKAAGSSSSLLSPHACNQELQDSRLPSSSTSVNKTKQRKAAGRPGCSLGVPCQTAVQEGSSSCSNSSSSSHLCSPRGLLPHGICHPMTWTAAVQAV
jgi:hypothetical protein